VTAVEAVRDALISTEAVAVAFFFAARFDLRPGARACFAFLVIAPPG
jgi:hypothetical protein